MESWKKKPIKSDGLNNCPCCHSLAEILPLETVLCNGFGGWSITKDGQEFYQGPHNAEWEDFKTLQIIENEIGDYSDNDFRAILFAPLRGAEFQRHAKNIWVLIEKNEGFA